MKAVFHFNEPDKLNGLNANLINMKKYDQNIEIVVVVNGPAVKLFTQKVKMVDDVKYHICNNALIAHDIDKSNLPEGLQVVPSGVVDLLQLQNKGFAYIKP